MSKGFRRDLESVSQSTFHPSWYIRPNEVNGK